MQLLPLLQPIITKTHKQEERKATISLQLLATITEVGDDHVVPHILNVVTLVQGEVCKRIPSHLEPQPQVLKQFPYLPKQFWEDSYVLPTMSLFALNNAPCVKQMVKLGFVAVALLAQTWDGIDLMKMRMMARH